MIKFIEIIDEITVKLFDPTGKSSFLYKYNGQWESEKQRRKRMRTAKVCWKCGKTYYVAAEICNQELAETQCNSCLNEYIKKNKHFYNVRAWACQKNSRLANKTIWGRGYKKG